MASPNDSLDLQDLPSELLGQILSYLPLYDQLFAFGAVSRHLNAIAIQHHSMSKSLCAMKESPINYEVDLRPCPSVATDCRSLVCAMDYQTLQVWDASSGCSSFDRHIQSVSYDTCVQPLSKGKSLLLWDLAHFRIYEPFQGGYSKPLYYQGRVGKKQFIMSHTGKYLACKINNFDQSFTEIYDFSSAEITSIQQWPCGLIDLEFSPDDSRVMYLSHENELVLHRVNEDYPVMIQDVKAATAAKFSNSGSFIAVAHSDRTVTLFNRRLAYNCTLGQPRRARAYCHQLMFSEDDDLVLLHTEDKDHCTAEHIIEIWALPSRKLLFSRAVEARKVLNFKLVAMVSYLHGILILIDGVLECWIFSQGGIDSGQPIHLMQAAIEEKIMSSAVSMLNAHVVAIGRKNGSVTMIPLPRPVDLLKKQHCCWVPKVRSSENLW